MIANSCGIHLAEDMIHPAFSENLGPVRAKTPEGAPGIERTKMNMLLKKLSLGGALLAVLVPAPADAGSKWHGIGAIVKFGGVNLPIGAKPPKHWRRYRNPGSPGPHFVPPSLAAKRAQHRYGGKVLGVYLRGGIYFVKLRGRGRVWIVRVHAASGRVMGR